MAILSPMPRISIQDYREQIQLRAVKAGLELGASGNRSASLPSVISKCLVTRREGYPCARITLASGLKLALVYKQI